MKNRTPKRDIARKLWSKNTAKKNKFKDIFEDNPAWKLRKASKLKKINSKNKKNENKRNTRA